MTRGEVQAAFGSFEFRRTSAAHSRSSMRVRPATRTLPPRAWRSGRPVRVLRSTQTFVWTDGRYSPGFALTLSAKRMRQEPGMVAVRPDRIDGARGKRLQHQPPD